MSDVLIIGGGLAGIAAGRALGPRAHILEAQDRLGGLARTDVIDGFWFDWTGHWLHLRTPKWKAEVDRLLPGGLLTIERQACIYSSGVVTPFPFQVNTYGLPPPIVADCLRGFIQATIGPEGAERRASELKTFHDYVLRYLGEGINRHFMEPYNRKLYTVDPAELSAEWGGRFVPKPSLDEVIDGAVGIVRTGIGYNATFVYPAIGGIEALPKALASELACSVSLGARVQRIDTRKRQVHLSDGRSFGYESLLSTIPLKALVGRLDPCPPAVQEAANRLRSISVTCVEIGVRQPPPKRFHWMYLPGPEVPFYRVGSPSQVNPALAPPGCTSYAVEVSHQGPPPESGPLIESVLDGMERIGLLSKKNVVLARARTIPVAYVLVDHACAEARKTILSYLDSVGIDLAGRYGQWEYSGMEDALVSGDTAAARIAARASGAEPRRVAS